MKLRIILFVFLFASYIFMGYNNYKNITENSLCISNLKAQITNITEENKKYLDTIKMNELELNLSSVKIENMNNVIENLKSELLTIKEKYDEIQILNDIDVSAYTLSKKETDENPNEAAWGKPIVGKTCAVSKDLSYLKHKFIKIDGFDTVLFVNDTMHSRFKNSVDVLVKDKKMANTVGRSERRIIVLGS